MSTYDPDACRFASLPASGDYWGPAMPKRKEFLKENGKKLNTTRASPWFYDTATGKWERTENDHPRPDARLRRSAHLPPVEETVLVL